MSGPRPWKPTDGELYDISLYATQGLTDAEIADRLGKPASTFRRHKKSSLKIQAAIKRGRLKREELKNDGS